MTESKIKSEYQRENLNSFNNANMQLLPLLLIVAFVQRTDAAIFLSGGKNETEADAKMVDQ